MARGYFTKCRDLAKSLLDAQPLDVPRFDLAHVYLEAADELGPEAAADAVKQDKVIDTVRNFAKAPHLRRFRQGYVL